MTETMTVNSNHLAGNEAGTDPPPLEWLESQICELAAHLAAATSKFLQLTGDFDARGRGRGAAAGAAHSGG